MTFLNRKKTRLEKLQTEYGNLMRKSFETSLRDREKSLLAKKKAQTIYEEITYLSVKRADK